MRFVLFWCIRDRLIALRNSVQNGPNYCKRSCHKVVSDFFTTKAPDPPPCDPKLTFWCVRTIWLHSGQFGCLTKLDAKQAELVQKIVPQSRVRFFRNEGTRSTPCDPKLTFWCVRTIWVHSGLFGCLTKLDAKWAKQVQKFVPRSRVGIFRNKSTRSTPLDPKLTF